MQIEDKLRNIDRLLLIESLPYETAKTEEQRSITERELTAIYERLIPIELVSSSDVTDNVLSGRNNSLVIFNSHSDDGDQICHLPSLLNARRLTERLKQLSPNSDYSVLSNLGKIESGPLKMALEMILKIK